MDEATRRRLGPERVRALKALERLWEEMSDAALDSYPEWPDVVKARDTAFNCALRDLLSEKG